MQKKSSRLFRHAVVNFVLLVFLWLLEWLVGERNWLVTLPTYAPPLIFAPVTLVLLVVSLVRRARFAVAVNLAAVLFVAVALMGFRLHFPNSTPADLRVMTFNVEKWSHGAGNVAAAIRAQRPEVVCLQEAGKYFWLTGKDETPAALEAAMPEYAWTASGEIMVGSRLPVLETHVHALPPGPKERPAVEVVVKVGEKRVSVVSVHLIPSQFDNIFREPGKRTKFYIDAANGARLTQAAQLLESLRGVKNPLIIGGDFNSQPQTQVCQTLTNAYSDAFDAAGNGFGYSLTAKFPVTRVDHLLLGNHARIVSVFVPNIVASDHRPLVADVALR